MEVRNDRRLARVLVMGSDGSDVSSERERRIEDDPCGVGLSDSVDDCDSHRPRRVFFGGGCGVGYQ